MNEEDVYRIAEELSLNIEPITHEYEDPAESRDNESDRSDESWWMLSEDNESRHLGLALLGLGADGEGAMLVARQRWEWVVHELRGPLLNSKDVKRIATYDDADQEVRDVIRRRKKSLRRCILCRQRMAPEHGGGDFGEFVCFGCQETKVGIVF